MQQGAAEVARVRGHGLNMTSSARSKMYPPLAKAELMSEAGDTSEIRYLRKVKNRSVAVVREWVKCVGICSADTKVSAAGGRGGATGARAEIPVQPMVKTMVMQVAH